MLTLLLVAGALLAASAGRAPASCTLGLPEGTGVSVANASELLLYRTLIWTKVCGSASNSFAADVKAFESTGNASALLSGYVCKQNPLANDDSVCEQYFGVWASLPGWTQCKPAVRAKDTNYAISQLAKRCERGQAAGGTASAAIKVNCSARIDVEQCRCDQVGVGLPDPSSICAEYRDFCVSNRCPIAQQCTFSEANNSCAAGVACAARNKQQCVCLKEVDLGRSDCLWAPNSGGSCVPASDQPPKCAAAMTKADCGAVTGREPFPCAWQKVCTQPCGGRGGGMRCCQWGEQCGFPYPAQPTCAPGEDEGENSIRVSCIGDSITTSTCGGIEGGYQDILQKQLNPQGKFLVSGYGASGMTMLKNGTINDGPLGGGTYWNTSAFRLALNSTPDVVTIMLGTNDAKEENWFGVPQRTGDSFVSDYKAMIALFAALPSKPKIYLAVPPPLYPPFPYNMNASVINEVLPQLLRKLARETPGVEPTVIDVHTALSNQTCITCDGCHPHGDRGYQEVAKAFAAVLNPQGSPPLSPPPAGSPPQPPVPSGVPSKPSGGVLLFQNPAHGLGNGSVLVPFADFVSSCAKHPTAGAPPSGRLSWNGCDGADLLQRPLLFQPGGGRIWDSSQGSHIGSFRVVGSVTVGFDGPCGGGGPGSTGLSYASTSNGTIKAVGQNLYFETALPTQWVPACCAQ